MISEESLFGVLLAAQIIIGVIVFVYLFYIDAPYGRYSNAKWGRLVNPKLGWFMMEIPAPVLHFLFFLKGHGYNHTTLTMFVIIFESHYVYRAIIYPMIMQKTAKPMPFTVAIMGFVFNFMNGYLNGYGIYCKPGNELKYADSWIETPQFLIGELIFIVGIAINIYSDYILRHLRAPGESGYKIPDKGLHKLVANPNYFGELIEWCGWAILTFSWSGAAFAWFTFANLAPRAYRNKLWYRKTFGSQYPASRKAIIPYIF